MSKARNVKSKQRRVPSPEGVRIYCECMFLSTSLSWLCESNQKFSHYCLTQTDDEGNTLYKIAKCSRDRSGKMMKNGECCCHGCLRKNEDNKCSQNNRNKRAGEFLFEYVQTCVNYSLTTVKGPTKLL